MSQGKYRVAPAHLRTWNGKCYSSKAEMEYAQLLLRLVESGQVTEYTEQPMFRLGCPENTYRPDFLVIEHTGRVYCVDVKGAETRQFKKNCRLWRAYGRVPLHVVKKTRKGFATVRVEEPGT